MVDDPYAAREAEKYSDPIPSREYIIAHLTQRQTPVDRQTLSQELGLYSEQQLQALHRRLRAMERDGQLVFTRRQCYVLPERLELLRGRVIGHREGFGFLRVEGYKEDLFLTFSEMRQVLHGDEILAQPFGDTRRGRREARVVRVLVPRQGPIVGRYQVEAGLGVVIPDDQRLNFTIAIPPDNTAPAPQTGEVVVVQLLQRPTSRHQAVGNILEVLGDPLAPGIEIEMAIHNYEIPCRWPAAVLEQIASLSEQVPPEAYAGRVDLRDRSFVTIDGEDARDFDDAVYCEERRGKGWRLWVAIADVSHYVQPNTPLDEEAKLRGNSVYFPLQVVPMLPEILSNGLCSLNPKVDRLCLVCEMTLTAHGKLSGYQFYEAVIHSQARFTYTQIAQLLAGDPALNQQFTWLVPMLQRLHQLFITLKQGREQRGSLELETEEPQFIFNSQRRIERIVPLVRNEAHKLIEECMIVANTAAALFVQKRRATTLYRVHDIPNEDRLTAFRQFLAELGLTLGGGVRPSPKDFAHLMQQTRHRPDSELIQTLLLRSLQPALYTPDNRGHFGLALPAYAHFTSPIRRYPDLLLHRTIKGLIEKLDCTPPAPQLEQAPSTSTEGLSLEDWTRWGEHCSVTERRADEATREVADWLKCEFMQEHVGMQFQGVIASVTNFGFFVRLEKLFIDGLVHVSSLDNDYYQFDPVSQQLVGQSLGLSFRLGDAVQVRVAAVNLDQRKIDFALIQSERRHAKRPRLASPLPDQQAVNPPNKPFKRARATENSKTTPTETTPTKPLKPRRSRRRPATKPS